MAVNWAEAEQEVTETETVQASAVLLLTTLKQALDEAGTDPVKLKALSDRLNTTTNALADAVAANTPSAEDPAPVRDPSPTDPSPNTRV